MKEVKGGSAGSRSLRRPLAAFGVFAVATALVGAGAGTALASSHREAPLIAGDPQHDNTDVYAFVSPDNPNTVTLIANFIPFEEPNGGPNFYPFAAGSHYDINIDNSGTGKPDITYRWTFSNSDSRANAPDGGTFLYNDGVVNSLDSPNLLFKQTYTLEEITPSGTKTLLSGAPVAPSDVGPASMPNYAALRQAAITRLPDGGQAIAGQSADPFFLDLRVFDLLYGANFSEAGHNTLAGYNVNFLAIQVPKNDVALSSDATKNPVIGIWSTSEKQTMQLSAGDKQTATGDFVQVSRLGNPLVNEVVIPAQLKDAFNGLQPYQDHTVQAAVNRVLDPEVPLDIQKIYGLKAPPTPRNDLAEIFLTGICKACGPIKADLNSQRLNQGVSSTSFVPSEELRLNMSIPPTANPNRLGVLGKDLQGFPNGRRLTDDVVDIELLALEGVANGAPIPAALANGDGVNAPANPIGSTFPYVALPNDHSVNRAASFTSLSGGGAAPSGGVGTGAGGTAAPVSDTSPALPVGVGVAGLALVSLGIGAVRRNRAHEAR